MEMVELTLGTDFIRLPSLYTDTARFQVGSRDGFLSLSLHG